MQQIDEDAGPLVVMSRLRTLANRLRSRPDTTPLAADVVAARTAVHARHEAWLEGHDATLSATGAVAFADDVEDDAIADLARRVKVLTKGDLTSPAYLRLFSQAPSALTKGVADDDQAALADHLLATLPVNGDYVDLRDALPALKAARAGVVSAQAERKTREGTESTAWTELQLAERKAREVYRDTEPRLLTLFPGRRRLVDSFFYKEPRRKKPES